MQKEVLRNIWDHAQDALSIIFKITPDNMISRFCGARETVELLSFNAKRGRAKYEDIQKKIIIIYFQYNFH